MSQKLLWAGLTLLMTQSLLLFIPAVNIVGAILMIIGLLLYLFDRKYDDR